MRRERERERESEYISTATRGGHAHLKLAAAVGAPEAGAMEEEAIGRHPLHQVDPLGAEEAEVARVIGGSEARLKTARGCLWSRTG